MNRLCHLALISALVLGLWVSEPQCVSGQPIPPESTVVAANQIAEPHAKLPHWSFRPPIKRPLPVVQNAQWCRNEVDYFVLAQLEAARLTPEPEADKYRLIRRLSLDLTGLPPTLAEIDAFVLDHRSDAYERLVDRLLASPRYGEHWARKWLDLARYADSQGYAQDEPRVIWPYRDWVIGAFNRDLPYDQFAIEQLAGDMLPDATLDQLIATGFHRNTMTNTEGGTDDEEFRHAAIVDRVNTTMQVWMGLTYGCAQCHSHKYDPITQDDYYGLFAVFNQTEDTDQPDNRPTISNASPTQQSKFEALKAAIAGKERAGLPPSPEWRTERGRLEKDRADLARLEALIVQTPVMRELPPHQQRTTHVHIRGAFRDQGEEVTPGPPEYFAGILNPPPADRLAFARWLVDRNNSLTSRVAVNRHWEQFFGTGIVETSEDFGTQGTTPSHPLLLDWLAIEFMDRGWSMKELCRLIVTSAVYRQSSRATPQKLVSDPQNRLFSRGARFRLSAEQLRDQALAVSGLLSSKMFGPPVYPPKPKSGLTAAFGASLDWEPSPGEDRFRRGIYTFWRRTDPYPSMMALDAAAGTVCTIRRLRTNTPVGVFVTLNDPAFFQCAQALASRVLSEAGPTSSERAAYAFRCVLARPPTPVELRRLTTFFETQLDYFRKHPTNAEQLSTISAYNADISSSNGDGDQRSPLGDRADGNRPLAEESAAWTVLANVLLNLDETLTKN